MNCRAMFDFYRQRLLISVIEESLAVIQIRSTTDVFILLLVLSPQLALLGKQVSFSSLHTKHFRE